MLLCYAPMLCSCAMLRWYAMLLGYLLCYAPVLSYYAMLLCYDPMICSYAMLLGYLPPYAAMEHCAVCPYAMPLRYALTRCYEL
eukprot:2031241-Rhodomonas_salina.1